jgi:hypothetical protein
MAQSGYTPIQLYRSTTAAATPSAGNLADGELALNTTDEKLYFKNASGTVKLLASSAGASGTVSSVAATGGTGISVTGSPITSSGTLTITNTAPDQVVSLTGAGTTTVTGTYPSFTITSNDQYAGTVTSVAASGGTTGMSFTGSPITTSGTLTLAGTLAVTNGGTGTSTQFTAGSVVFAGTSGVYSQDNANLFWDDTNNRLGIGTSSPGTKLDVDGTIWARASAAAIGMDVIGRSADSGGQIRFLNNAASAALGTLASYGNDVALLNNTASYSLLLGTNSTERMRIDSSGNVGIGTSSPSSRLHVYGSGAEVRVENSNTVQYSGAAVRLKGGASTQRSTMLRHANWVTGGTSTYFAIENANAADSYISTIAFYDYSSQYWAFSTSATERLRIDSSGNVGIGISSPTSRLTIAGGIAEIRDGQPLMLRPSGNAWDMRLQATGTQLDILSGGALGSPIMSLVHGGNVGIGTSSPSQRLHVRQDQSGTTAALIQNRNATGSPVSAVQFISGAYDLSDNRYAMIASDGGSNTTLQFWTGLGATPVERMRIDSSGNVGIGNSNPTTKLWVGSSGGGSGTATPDAISLGNTFANSAGDPAKTKLRLFQDNTPVYYGFGVSANLMETHVPSGASMAWYTNATERMRIDSSGYLLVGTSSTFDNVSYLIAQFQGGVSTKIAGTGATSQMSFFNDNGRVGYIGTSGTTTTYYTSSDARMKENVADAEDAGVLVDSIQVRKFDWKADGSHQRYGFIAQELYEIAPEAVGGTPEDEQMMGVDYSKLVPMMLKEIQSLRARVAQLEGK